MFLWLVVAKPGPLVRKRLISLPRLNGWVTVKRFHLVIRTEVGGELRVYCVDDIGNIVFVLFMNGLPVGTASCVDVSGRPWFGIV
jgi:hypothetical protein